MNQADRIVALAAAVCELCQRLGPDDYAARLRMNQLINWGFVKKPEILGRWPEPVEFSNPDWNRQ